MTYDPLVYGKNSEERIVSLEVKDDLVELFKLDENGDVYSEFRSNKFWILSPEPFDKGWVRLKGNLHYQYGKQFTNREEFFKYRSICKKRNKDVYSIYNSKEACMVKDGYTYFKGLKPKDIPVLSFDLETTGLNPNSDDAKILLISNTFRKNEKLTKKLFCYDDYQSQGQMLKAWEKWINEQDPSIITGHNVIAFDFHYILGIAEQEGIDVCIGRDGSGIYQENYESKYRVDGSRDLHYKKLNCYGREIIDTMFLAYKYDAASKKYNSYGLKPIIKVEDLEKEGRTFYDASQIRFKYKDPKEWQLIKNYCIDDSDDSLILFDLMCPAYFYMTQSIPRSFQAVHESASGSQINSILVRSYIQESYSIPKADEFTYFEGGLSDSYPGVYKNALKFDASNLYPSIMRQYKITDSEKDPNGNFLKITEYFAKERLKNKKLFKETKNKYYDDLQSSQKIFANSLFGFMGAPGLNFNSMKNASLVTQKGREILKKAILFLSGNEYVKI